MTSAEVLQGAQHDVSVVPGLAPLYSDCYIAAPATTCACAPCDNLAMHYGLITAAAGSVLVCSTHGLQDCGYIGELAGIDAINRGIVGFVIDGSIRDASDLERLRVPVFHMGTAPGSCAKNGAVSVGEQITMGGVTVNPGDYIVADRDAVVVIPSDRWDAVKAAARKVREREDEMRSRLRSGERLSTMISLPADKPEERGTEAPTASDSA